MSVSEKALAAGRNITLSANSLSLPDEDLREIYLAMQAADDTTVSVNEAIKLADEAADHVAAAADDERNRLRGALRRVRAWLAGYVANGGKDADEELQIADAALAADDRQVEAGSVVDRYRRSKATASPTPDEPESDGPLCALDNPPYLPPAGEPSEDEVERVALAIVRADQDPCPDYADCAGNPEISDWSIHLARAAIAALRNKR